MFSHSIKQPIALARHKVSLHSKGIIFCRACVKKFKTAEQLEAHKLECMIKRKKSKNRTELD